VHATRAPDVAERFTRDGAEVIAGSADEFRRQIATETPLWARVIKEMGIKAE
jgi:tripartite-type tricarboxylate transporter receptor subunit TctC